VGIVGYVGIVWLCGFCLFEVRWICVVCSGVFGMETDFSMTSTQPELARGGILADDMGLGKTLQYPPSFHRPLPLPLPLPLLSHILHMI
jgi:hypothetical protein